MITYKDFLRFGHKLLEKDEKRKELKELFLKAFKLKNIGSVVIYLNHLYDVFFRPENVFFDGVLYVKNEKVENLVKNEFAEYFLNEHIEEFINLYPVLKEKHLDSLNEFLPILIKFLPEAKPDEPKYFIALYLILADVLNIVDKNDFVNFRERFINLSTKGLARYKIKTDIFEGVISENYLKKINDYKNEVKPFKSFKEYYLSVLEDFEETLGIGRFNNEFALFLIFSSFIFESREYRDLLKEIKEKIKLDLIDEIIENCNLDINKERLKGNIKNILIF